MNKEIQTDIIKEDVAIMGRFTIIEIENEQGKKGIGIARRSFLDKSNVEVGVNIARGRAKRALYLKQNKKTLRHLYMG